MARKALSANLVKAVRACCPDGVMRVRKGTMRSMRALERRGILQIGFSDMSGAHVYRMTDFGRGFRAGLMLRPCTRTRLSASTLRGK